MRLNKIIIEGFKSFAHRTEINLSDGFTTIVGPNGSGKSNITDAIKWVLGDQSPKNLRGKSMQDVIFSGSDAKKAMSFAEVTLIIDNKNRELPIEFDEVALTRVVYKNGDSEYKINNAKARLKDIQELMIDSGVQASSFSMISQGKIESIFNSKPEDRRQIFEEAAGVLKFKRRKHEAELKIVHVENNLSRIDDIVHELKEQLKPLKGQKIKAEEYLKLKSELKDKEVALLSQQIKDATELKDTITKDNANLSVKNVDIDFEIKQNKTKIIELENKNRDIDEKIAEHQNKLISLNAEIQNLETKSLLDSGVTIDNKEFYITRLNTLKSNKTQKENELENKNEFIKELNTNDFSKEISDHRKQQKLAESELQKYEEKNNKISHAITRLQSRKEFIEQTKENLSNLHQGVRAVIENKKTIGGIIGTIYDLIEIDDQYKIAVEAALGSSLQYVATKSTKDSQKAIKYLKNQKAGKATFISSDNLNFKLIENNNYTLAKHQAGYIGLANELVQYAEEDKKIVDALLGNSIIVDTLENANVIYNELPKKVKVITLDGEIISPRGYITGGQSKNQKNGLLSMDLEIQKIPDQILALQHQFEDNVAEINELKQNKDNLNKIINEFTSKTSRVEGDLRIAKQIIDNINVEIENIDKEISEIEVKFNSKKDNDFKDHLSQEIKKAKAKKTLIEQQTDKLRNNVREDKNTERELRTQNERHQKELDNISRIKSKNEIEINKNELVISNALRRLSEEYQIIYSHDFKVEKTFENFEEELNKVAIIRNKIIQMGDVNIGSIEEYARIDERYQFINAQKIDTEMAKTNLVNLMKEMDKEMESRFLTTFEMIEIEFEKTFKELFSGGEAKLVLTDKKNLLETGVDIIARPPGKKLSRITLLSGGEKALTAISLLFAILKVKTIPFVILDEAEAALDDSNVDRYSQYLKNFKGNTQFLVITHRKGTMENADYLYGVTMQERGISKIVSVDLKNIDEHIEQ